MRYCTFFIAVIRKQRFFLALSRRYINCAVALFIDFHCGYTNFGENYCDVTVEQLIAGSFFH